tara:strand:+ start:526 stop:723 length:198 start_codon:yes stop_codon:yes gene_type:complete
MSDNMKDILGVTCWCLLILIIGMTLGQKSTAISSEKELINLSIKKTKLSIKLLNNKVIGECHERT